MTPQPQMLPGVLLELKEPPSLDKLHEMASEAAFRAQDEKGEAPFAWHLSSGHQLIVMLTQWRNDREKYAIVDALRDILRRTPRVGSYSFSGEAWVATYDRRTNESHTRVQPKDREDRREVLMVFTFHRDGGRRTDVYNMDRDKDGKIIRTRDDAFDHYDGMAGAMWDLFHPVKDQ